LTSIYHDVVFFVVNYSNIVLEQAASIIMINIAYYNKCFWMLQIFI